MMDVMQRQHWFGKQRFSQGRENSRCSYTVARPELVAPLQAGLIDAIGSKAVT
jgi:hypothetical protein